MNVAFVSNVVYPFVTGGAEKRIHEIGTRLAANGDDVTVYGRHFWDGPREMEYEGMRLRAVAPGTDLYTDDRRSITEAIDFAGRVAVPLRRSLRRNRHDVVVASVFPYFPVLASRIAGLGTGTPLVTTWHEVWGSYWKEYLDTLAPFGKLVEFVTANVSQHPIAVSEVTASRLADIGPVRDAIDVVPNGIDVERIASAPLPEESFDVLFAGRLIADKNVDLLLEAFDAVADVHDLTLGIIGEGPELERLKRKAASLQFGEKISFLGFLDSYDEVLGYMRTARVFASPSTREGFGITFAEAMAAGCTVIAADHPDSAADEVIGDAGLLVPPSVKAVKSALDDVFTSTRSFPDPTERAAQFDWDLVAERARRVYEQSIEESC